MKPSAAVVLSIAISAAVLVAISWIQPGVRTARLAECTNSTVRVAWVVPPGRGQTLAIGFPGHEWLDTAVSKPFKGRLEVRDAERVVYEMDFDSTSMESWGLPVPGEQRVPCLRLLSPASQGKPRLSSVVRARATYEVILRFEGEPPPGSSLWLSWVQRLMDNHTHE
jgi:hypothetical protein